MVRLYRRQLPLTSTNFLSLDRYLQLPKVHAEASLWLGNQEEHVLAVDIYLTAEDSRNATTATSPGITFYWSQVCPEILLQLGAFWLKRKWTERVTGMHNNKEDRSIPIHPIQFKALTFKALNDCCIYKPTSEAFLQVLPAPEIRQAATRERTVLVVVPCLWKCYSRQILHKAPPFLSTRLRSFYFTELLVERKPESEKNTSALTLPE